MNARIAANQGRTFLALLAAVRPHARRDSGLPHRLKELLGRNRALGARDRRLYRELIYTVLRFLPWIEPLLDADPDAAVRATAWLAPELPETSAFRATWTEGWPPAPAGLAAKAAVLRERPDLPPARPAFEPEALLPAWLREECPDAFTAPHLDSILARAPLWVRLQTDRPEMVLDEFRRRGWTARAEPGVPEAFALPPNAAVAASDAYRRGFVEIQDLGSQLVLALAPVAPGEAWLDACAGAGGKSLQLAGLVGPAGRVDASDVRPEQLDELRDRARRARLDTIRILAPADLGDGYDGVLVDAPCSGSGTWRRLPHRKWQTDRDELRAFATLQDRILAAHAPRVRPGGLLVYATCSLARTENKAVVEAFLAAHPRFRAERPARELGGAWDGTGTRLLPGHRDSDGFYVALLRAAS